MPSSTPADREPARTDAQAKERFLGVLGRSLSAVSTSAIWHVLPRGDSYLAVTAPEVVGLRSATGETTIYIRSTIEFVYIDDLRFGPPERKVSTRFYAHTVGSSPTLKPQLYSWEWSASEPRYPHVHVRRSDTDFHGLGKLHIPTGRVFYEHVLLFLVHEHGVQCVIPDGEAKLGESLRRVSTYATWGGGDAP